METANGKTTESAMPAENRYGYREGRTERPERSIEEMKRGTFVKQLMALWISRNKANKLCLEALESAAKYRESGMPVGLAWEHILAGTIDQLKVLSRVNAGSPLWARAGNKLFAWQIKRSKEDPRRSWSRNHPGM